MATAAARALAVRRAKVKEKAKEKILLAQHAKFLLQQKLSGDQKETLLHSLRERRSTTFLASLIEGGLRLDVQIIL